MGLAPALGLLQIAWASLIVGIGPGARIKSIAGFSDLACIFVFKTGNLDHPFVDDKKNQFLPEPFFSLAITLSTVFL